MLLARFDISNFYNASSAQKHFSRSAIESQHAKTGLVFIRYRCTLPEPNTESILILYTKC